MSDTLITLLKDPFAYLLLVGMGGVIRYYMIHRIAAGVDHKFALRLEDHKQSLRLAGDAARYDYEHWLSQAKMFTTNRHTATVEVYKALRIAHGRCVNLRGLRQDLTFEEFNEADLRDYMSSNQVPAGKQDQVMSDLEVDRVRAIEDMRRYLRVLEVQEAQNQLGQAKNTTYLNELYFDDEIISDFNDFFELMDRWMAYIQFPPEATERRDAPTKAQLQSALEAVHEILRTRLAGRSLDATSTRAELANA